MMRVRRCAVSVMTALVFRGSSGAPRSGLTWACVSRPGAFAISALVAPFVHKRPRFAGWSLSPETFTTVRRPVSASVVVSMRIPQPTPQYEQADLMVSVEVSVLLAGVLVTRQPPGRACQSNEARKIGPRHHGGELRFRELVSDVTLA